MEPSQAEMSTFYVDCIKAYHKTVQQFGFLPRELVYCSDLLPIGQKTTLEFLQDHFLQSEFSHDPETYYYVVMTFVLQCGIVFADRWHNSMDHLRDSAWISQVIADGPWDYAEPLITNQLQMDVQTFQLLCRHIYDNLLEKMEPWWQQKQARDHIFHAVLAAFQLGVSLVLDQYGINA